jgi:hypothetical protein
MAAVTPRVTLLVSRTVIYPQQMLCRGQFTLYKAANLSNRCLTHQSGGTRRYRRLPISLSPVVTSAHQTTETFAGRWTRVQSARWAFYCFLLSSLLYPRRIDCYKRTNNLKGIPSPPTKCLICQVVFLGSPILHWSAWPLRESHQEHGAYFSREEELTQRTVPESEEIIRSKLASMLHVFHLSD